MLFVIFTLYMKLFSPYINIFTFIPPPAALLL